MAIFKPDGNRRTVLKGGIVLAATAHSAVASGGDVRISPQERMDAAMAQIEQAMAEMHPGWQIDKRSDLVSPQTYVHDGFVNLTLTFTSWRSLPMTTRTV